MQLHLQAVSRGGKYPLEQLRKLTEPLLWKRSDAVPAVEAPGLVARVQLSGAETAEEGKNFNNELQKISPS